jgi:hypothetical protein
VANALCSISEKRDCFYLITETVHFQKNNLI